MTKITGYTPTPEQLEAQKARRAAQAAEKAAKKTTGNKTVFDKKQGRYISLDVEKAKATKAQKAAQKTAEEAAKKAGKFGGKTIPDPANPGKYISQTAAETAEKVGKPGKPEKPVKPTGKTSEGLLSKVGKFFKGKGGKIALIGAGIATLLGGGIYLYNKLTGKNDTPAQEEPVTSTPAPEETPDTTNTPVAPPAEQEKTPVTPPAESETETKEVPDNTVPKNYTVKEGDCVWNIAKQHLKDLNPDPNYKPTNAEILKHTKELMELNQLEFEPDGYHVMIRPNDNLKLTA